MRHRHTKSPRYAANEAKPAQIREGSDPGEKQRPLPWFVVMLIGAMAMWGVFYIYGMNVSLSSRYGDSRTPSALQGSGTASPGTKVGAAAPVDGAQIFSTRCAACHQTSGLGIPGVFPPLAGSEWVLGSDKVLVQIPLHGVTGALEVKGTTYNGAMPTFSGLTDEEIAAVLTHVRRQWGNSAPPVLAVTVKEGRDASKARDKPWATAGEIKSAAAP